jgi:hypothetical protein
MKEGWNSPDFEGGGGGGRYPNNQIFNDKFQQLA